MQEEVWPFTAFSKPSLGSSESLASSEPEHTPSTRYAGSGGGQLGVKVMTEVVSVLRVLEGER